MPDFLVEVWLYVTFVSRMGFPFSSDWAEQTKEWEPFYRPFWNCAHPNWNCLCCKREVCIQGNYSILPSFSSLTFRFLGLLLLQLAVKRGLWLEELSFSALVPCVALLATGLYCREEGFTTVLKSYFVINIGIIRKSNFFALWPNVYLRWWLLFTMVLTIRAEMTQDNDFVRQDGDEITYRDFPHLDNVGKASF